MTKKFFSFEREEDLERETRDRNGVIYFLVLFYELSTRVHFFLHSRSVFTRNNLSLILT